MPTIKELKAELKAKGIKGITGKKKAELEAMLAKAGGCGCEKDENDAFFEDAYKKLGKTPNPKKSKTDMGTFLKNAEKKLKPPHVKQFTRDPKTGKLMKIPTEPVIDKQISAPKEKIKMNLQEELAKAGLRGGMKKKFKV